MSELKIEKAVASDNIDICKLCRIPMTGTISLSMEREPNYFSCAEVQSEELEVYVCRHLPTNKIVGLFSVGKRNVFHNGIPTTMRYFSDLRIDTNFQGSMVLAKMSWFIKKNQLLEENEFAHAVVFAENKTMRDVIEKINTRLRKNSSLLKFSMHGNYNSYLVSLRKKRENAKIALQIRRAETNDITTMQEFFNREACAKQWYPCYDFSRLSTPYYSDIKIENFYLAFSNDELVGITGVWDQKKFKQTKIYSYSKWLGFLRPFINSLSSITNGFYLPAVGEQINYFSLHTIAIKNNESSIFKGLVEKIHKDNCQKEYNYFLCGLDKNDSLNAVFDGFAAKRTVHGCFYLASFTADIHAALSIPKSGCYYMEAARI